jgi:hypothetical protein
MACCCGEDPNTFLKQKFSKNQPNFLASCCGEDPNTFLKQKFNEN